LRIRTAVLISLTMLVLVSLISTLFLPSVDDLWHENPFWNGISQVYVSYKPLTVSGFTGFSKLAVSPDNSTVLMVGPSLLFTDFEVEEIRSYITEGGHVVLADDFGSGNSLLEGLGLRVRFSGELLQDKLFNEKKMMPRILLFAESAETAGVKELVMNYPTTLNIDRELVLAWASSSSTVGGQDQASGFYPVMAKVGIGKGSIVLISDSSIFINDMIERGDNALLLANLIKGSIIIDEAHSTPSKLTYYKAALVSTYEFLGYPEVKYSLIVVIIVGVFKVSWDDNDEKVNEVEETLRTHPEWDRRQLEELQETRRKARGDQ
jgi:hypothetical protein